MIGESVLHLERQRAADRVEPVDRIAGNERHPIDGVLRDEVPIDDVAEHFVDAHPVLIDGEALRRADHRRGNEAAVIEVELELIAGLVAQRDAGQSAHQGVEQARRRRLIEIGGGKGLDIGRDLVAIDRAGLGRRRDVCRGRSG